jgi:hypothetical protein
MFVPGSNLLRLARTLIRFQSIKYYPAESRTLNAARQYVPTFGSPFTMKASVQAVDRNSYANMGLDFNSLYVQVYAELNMIDLERDSSGDRFVYNGDIYAMSKGQNWFAQDGWATCLAIRIGSVELTPF